MATSTFVQVTQGGATKLHTVTEVIGPDTVHREVHLDAEAYLATYAVTIASPSVATANDHVMQIMAGSSLTVYLRRLRIVQSGLATTAAIMRWTLLRLTTAGTGGSAVTPVPHDTTDPASGATAMTLPTAKGTEGSQLDSVTVQFIQIVPTSGNGLAPVQYDQTWDWSLRSKMPRIAAGPSNGIALKNLSAIAGASVVVHAVFSEANF